MRRPLLLWLEFSGLYLGLPLAHAAGWLPVPIFPALWLLAAVCLVVLLRDRGFDRSRLWNASAARAAWVWIVLPALVALPLLWAITLWVDPTRLFGFVKSRPALWALVIVLYPLLSVLPQGIVYRVFLFRRYRSILPSPAARIAAGALAFAAVHLVFRNWVAPPLTLVAGLLFCWTYERTRSGLAVALQHALLGDLVFTIGIGWFFYAGSISA